MVAVLKTVLESFGKNRRMVVAAWLLIGFTQAAVSVASTMAQCRGGPDLSALVVLSLCVVPVGVGLLWYRYTQGRELQMLVVSVSALTLVGLVVVAGPLITDLMAGGMTVRGVPAIDPILVFAPMLGLIGLVGLIKVALFPGEGFTRSRFAALGDARWLSMTEAANVFPPDGEIVIGECYRPDQERRGHQAFDPATLSTWGSGGQRPLLTFKLNFDSTHMLFFAGSGGFKTTSIVIPTALRFTGSMVVLDPAREVGQTVGGVRSQMKVSGTERYRTVVVLDPMADIVQGCDVLEPIANSASLLTDSAAFARLLTTESPKRGGGTEAFFEIQSMNLMHGLLVYVLASAEFEGKTQLNSLRSLTSLPEMTLKEKIGSIVTNDGNSDGEGFIANHIYRQFVRETLGPFVSMADQTWTGVASSVAKDTQWLSIPTLRALVCGTTFSVADFPKGWMDVFIQVPGDLMKSYPGVCRTLIGALMTAKEKDKDNFKRRVLFCLDEVDLLGYMSLLEEARDRGRKYGITLMMMYQSVGQLEKHFSKEGATSWFEGASFASYAAIKSRETAEQLSKQVGDVTVEVRGRSHSSGWHGWLDKGDKSTQSVSMQRRALILPHEIREMRSDEQIIMVRGYPALRAGRAIFFRRPEMVAATQATDFTRAPQRVAS